MVNFSINNPSFLNSNNPNDIKHYIGKEHDLRVESNTVMSKNLNVQGNIVVTGNTLVSRHIIPTNNDVNLGTTINPFKDIFVQGSSIFLSNFKMAIYDQPDGTKNFGVRKINTNKVPENLNNFVEKEITDSLNNLFKIKDKNTGLTIIAQGKVYENLTEMTLADWTIIASKYNINPTNGIIQTEENDFVEETTLFVKGNLNITHNINSDSNIYLHNQNKKNKIGIGTYFPLVSLDIGQINDAILLPRGTINERPGGSNSINLTNATLSQQHRGLIRYNTETDAFEGFGAGDSWASLGGASLKDVNKDTYISVEDTPDNPGDPPKNNDQIKFYTGDNSVLGNSEFRMIIQNQENKGYVGIGTNNPQSALHIVGNTGGIKSFKSETGTGGLNNVKFLINSNSANGNNIFTDISNSTHTINYDNTGPYHSTTQKKFNNSSIYFPYNNSNTNNLKISNHSDFDLSNNDFTIECWIYIEQFSGTYNDTRVIYQRHQDNVAIPAYGITVRDNGELQFSCRNDNNTNLFQLKTNLADNLNLNTWYHIAVVRYSNNITLYKNGINVDSDIFPDNSIYFHPTYDIYIGGTGIGGGQFYEDTRLKGYLDGLKFTNGEALYTQNFTIPTVEFNINPVSAIIDGIHFGHLNNDYKLQLVSVGSNSSIEFKKYNSGVNKDQGSILYNHDLNNMKFNIDDIELMKIETKKLNIYNNTNIFSNLNVTNNANILHNLNVFANANILHNLNVFANSNILQQLNVHQNINLGSNINILGNILLNNSYITDLTKLINFDDNNLKTTGKADIKNITLQNSEIINNLDDLTIKSLDGDVNIKNNTNINSNLNILGNTNIFSNLNITENTNIFSNLNVFSNTNIKHNLNVYDKLMVQKYSYLSNILLDGLENSDLLRIVNKNDNLDPYLLVNSSNSRTDIHTLRVNHDSHLVGDLVVDKNTLIKHNLNVLGNTNISLNLNVIGNSNILSNLNIFNNTNINSNLNIFGNTNMLGDLKINKNANILSNLNVFSNANINHNLNVFANANITDNMHVFGKVGIGESDPSVKLHIQSNDDKIFQLYMNNSHLSGAVGMNWVEPSGKNLMQYIGDGVMKTDYDGSDMLFVQSDDGNFSFETYSATNGQRYPLFINGSTNYVGIGTNNPTHNLHIEGNMIVTQNANILSNLNILNNTNINSNLNVFANANILSQLNIFENTNINSNLNIFSNTNINDNLHVYGSIAVNNPNPIVSLDLTKRNDGILLPRGNYGNDPTNTSGTEPFDNNGRYIKDAIGDSSYSIYRGLIRYNTTKNIIETYGMNNTWLPVNGPIFTDTNKDTYISNESAAGYNEDELRFFTGVKTTYSPDSITNPKMIIDGNVNIYNNTNINSNLNIIGNTNIQHNLNLYGNLNTYGSVGIGTKNPLASFHIQTKDGLLLPKGQDTDRSVGDHMNNNHNKYRGLIRYNTQKDIFEGYGAGNQWSTLGGGSLYDTDKDTGITVQKSAIDDTDEIRFFTGDKTTYAPDDTLKMIIDGNVNIYNNTNINSNLNIIGNTNIQHNLNLYGNLNTYGSVGIGTKNPLSSFHIESKDGLLIPKGQDTDRSVGDHMNNNHNKYRGLIRYNTQKDIFEGYGAGNEWSTLGGGSLYDTDKDTGITVQKSANDDTDEIRFYTGDVSTYSSDNPLKMIIDGNVNIYNNTNINSNLNIIGNTNIQHNLNILNNLYVKKDGKLDGNLLVSGDFTVQGTTTTINTQTVTIEDNMIELSKNNTADITDFGIFGKYNDNPLGGGNDAYAGLFRDATDGKFNLFKNVSSEPDNNFIDKSNNNYQRADLIMGDLDITNSNNSGYSKIGPEPHILTINSDNIKATLSHSGRTVYIDSNLNVSNNTNIFSNLNITSNVNVSENIHIYSNLGIGTTKPLSSLHIIGHPNSFIKDQGAEGIRIGRDTNNYHMEFCNDSNLGATQSQITFSNIIDKTPQSFIRFKQSTDELNINSLGTINFTTTDPNNPIININSEQNIGIRKLADTNSTLDEQFVLDVGGCSRFDNNLNINSNLNTYGNISVSSNLIVTGNTIISDHLIPSHNKVDLGTTTNPFRHIFLSSDSLYIQNFRLGVDENDHFSIKKININKIPDELITHIQFQSDNPALSTYKIIDINSTNVLNIDGTVYDKITFNHTLPQPNSNNLKILNLGDWTKISKHFNINTSNDNLVHHIDNPNEIVQDSSFRVDGNLNVKHNVNCDSNTYLYNANKKNKLGIGTNLPLVTLDTGQMTDAILLPRGLTNQRPGQNNADNMKNTTLDTKHKGLIRYNMETDQFEGFGAGLAWGSLGGVIDVNQDTKIEAESSAGIDNDELRFFTGQNHNVKNYSGTVIDIEEHKKPKMIIDGNVNIYYNTNINSNLNIIGNTNIKHNLNVFGNTNLLGNLNTYGSVGIGTHTAKCSLHIDRRDAIMIPNGTTSERPTHLMRGLIRYNTDNEQFEGFGAGDAWGSLGGVSDVDQDTYISAETSAGDDNDELRFYTGNDNDSTTKTPELRMIIDGNINILYNTNIDSNLNIIGNTNIKHNLNVFNNANISADLLVHKNISSIGNLNVGGNTILSNDLLVHKNISSIGNLNVAGNTILSGDLLVHKNISSIGNLNVGGNTILSNDLLVHKNISSIGNLNVGGNTILSGDLLVHKNISSIGNLNVGGNTILSGDLLVHKNISSIGNLNVGGNTILSGDLLVHKNISSIGNLNVGGNTILSGDLLVHKNISSIGNLNVGGNTILSGDLLVHKNISSIGNLNVGGNTILSGDLLVHKNISSIGNLNVGGNTILSGDLLVHKNISSIGNLNVGGNTILSGDLLVYKNISSIGNLNVGGNTILSGDLLVHKNISSIGNLNVGGNTILSGDLLVHKNISSIGNLNVGGNTILSGDLLVHKNISSIGNLNVGGNTILSGDLLVHKNISSIGNLNVGGNTILSGDLLVHKNISSIGNLNVGGNTILSGDLLVHKNISSIGNLNVGGNTILSGDLLVHKNISSIGNLNVGGNTILSGDLLVHKNISSIGNLNVGGNTILSGDLLVHKNISSIGNLNVGGNTILSADLLVHKNITSVGNLNVGGNLIVSGSFLNTTGVMDITCNANILSNLNVLANTNIDSNLNVFGNLNVVSNLIVAGNTILSRNLLVYKNISSVGNLNVGGNTILSGDLLVHKNIASVGNLNIGGNTILSGDLLVHKNIASVGNLNVGGNTILSGDLLVYKNISSIGNLNVGGNTILSSDLLVNKNISSVGNLNVGGNTILSGNLNIYGTVGIGTKNPLSSFHIERKDALLLPKGEDNDRPVNNNKGLTNYNKYRGLLRYNTENNQFEGYGANNEWGNLLFDNQSEVVIKSNLIVSGNLSVIGNHTFVNASTLEINDNMFKMAGNNTTNFVDFGWYGRYNDGADDFYQGTFIDSSDENTMKFFKSKTEPGYNDLKVTDFELTKCDGIWSGYIEANGTLNDNTLYHNNILISDPLEYVPGPDVNNPNPLPNPLPLFKKKVLTQNYGIIIDNSTANELRFAVDTSTLDSRYSGGGVGTSNVFWTSPPYIINNLDSTTPGFQTMYLAYQNMSSSLVNYIIPQNITVTHITIIQTEETDLKYDINIISDSTTNLIQINEINPADGIKKIKLSTDISLLKDKLLKLEIDNTTSTIDNEEVLIILEGYYTDLSVNSSWNRTNASNRLYSTSNIGIGTNNPLSNLHLYGHETNNYKILISNEDASSSTSLGRIAWSNKDANTNNLSAYIDTTNYDGLGLQQPTNTGNLVFATSNNTSNPIERMRITSDGKIGINTANPQYILDIDGTLNCTTLRVGGTVLGAGTGVWSNQGVSNNINYKLGNVGIKTDADSNNALTIDGDINITTGSKFKINNIEQVFGAAANNYWTKVTNDLHYSSGNIGINTIPDPSNRLDVNGDINLTGDLKINGVVQSFSGTALWSQTGNDLYYDAGSIGIGTNSNPRASLDIQTTDAIIIPCGTQAERPTTELEGMIRFNKTTNEFEGWNNSIWSRFGSGSGTSEQINDINNKTKITAQEDGVIENKIRFYTNITDTNNPNNELRMIIDQNGNIGIGNSTPTQKLDVTGTIKATTFVGPLTGSVTGTVSDLSNHNTTNLTEGGNLYYTDTRARVAISLDNSNNSNNSLSTLSYDNSTGLFTFNSVTDTAIKALLSAGTGVTYDNSTGEISVGQEVKTTSDVQFSKVIATNEFSGNLNGNASSSNTSEQILITLDNSSSTTYYIPYVDYNDNFPATEYNGLSVNQNFTILRHEPSGEVTITATHFKGDLEGISDFATNIMGGDTNLIPFQSAFNTTTFDTNFNYNSFTQLLTVNNITCSTSITTDSFTDGTLTLTGGEITNAVSITATTFNNGGLQISAGDISGAGLITAATFNGALDGNANTSSQINIQQDNTTSSDFDILFTDQSSYPNNSNVYSSSKLYYNPGANCLECQKFKGNLEGIANSSVSIDVTEDITTNAAMPITFVTGDGTSQILKSNDNLNFNPNTGNVGIGTTASSWKFRVNGDTHLGDALDDIKYGIVQITRPKVQGIKYHLAFIRNGQTVTGMGFLNDSPVFGIQNQSSNNTSTQGIFLNGNKIGINTTSPQDALHVNGTQIIRNTDIQTILRMKNHLILAPNGQWNIFTNYSATNDNFHIQNPSGGGGVFMSPGNTAWQSMSDDRLKHNEIDITNGLDVIMKLKPQFYDRSAEMLDADFNGDLDELDIKYYKESGFIAQEVYEIPELRHIVNTGNDSEFPFWSIIYQQIIPYNTSAIQQLKAEKDALETKVSALETKNTELETKVATLETQVADLLARVLALENNN